MKGLGRERAMILEREIEARKREGSGVFRQRAVAFLA
jgi:hypothetical protein